MVTNVNRLIRYILLCAVGMAAGGCAVPIPVAVNLASIAADSYSVLKDGRTTTDRLVALVANKEKPGDDTGVKPRLAGLQDTENSFSRTSAEPADNSMDNIRGAGAAGLNAFAARDFKPAQVLVNGIAYRVPIRSLKAQRWQRVVQQEHDISCGAAVVATLLTYHYGMNTSEKAIFEQMLKRGDKKKIRKFGFSMLDMKLYLKSRGLRAEGFRASLNKLASVGIPAIVLLNLNGYRHFVLVKGIRNDKVLVGDPAFGIKIFERAKFESLLVNDIVFVLLDRGSVGKKNFNRKVEWAHLAKAPIELARDMNTLESIFRMTLPSTNEF